MVVDDETCDFRTGQFVLGLTSKGLTNQRLAVVTYQLLAGALNRTLVLPSIRTGNVPMCRGAQDRDACMARLSFSTLYDVPILRSRLAPPFRACCCASEALVRVADLKVEEQGTLAAKLDAFLQNTFLPAVPQQALDGGTLALADAIGVE